MSDTKTDLSVVEQFHFEIPPVGVKYCTREPAGLERLGEHRAFCEMLRLAQGGRAFFAAAGDHSCEAGLYVLGQAEAPGPYISGEFGAGLKIFAEPRAAARLYQYIPRIRPGVARFVALAPFPHFPFDPDVLVVLSQTGQTETLLRAMSYRTGQMWSSRYSPAIGCAWIMIYPYLTGKLNYTLTGFGHGMKRRKLFPEGRQLVSIPFDLLPSLLQNLRDMPWELPAFGPDGEAYVRRLMDSLGIQPPPPSTS